MKNLFPLLRISILIFCLFNLVVSVRAQDKKVKFGKVSKDDLLMTRYDKDTTAEAVILDDIGQTYFDYLDISGFMMVHER